MAQPDLLADALESQSRLSKNCCNTLTYCQINERILAELGANNMLPDVYTGTQKNMIKAALNARIILIVIKYNY